MRPLSSTSCCLVTCLPVYLCLSIFQPLPLPSPVSPTLCLSFLCQQTECRSTPIQGSSCRKLHPRVGFLPHSFWSCKKPSILSERFTPPMLTARRAPPKGRDRNSDPVKPVTLPALCCTVLVAALLCLLFSPILGNSLRGVLWNDCDLMTGSPFRNTWTQDHFHAYSIYSELSTRPSLKAGM